MIFIWLGSIDKNIESVKKKSKDDLANAVRNDSLFKLNHIKYRV